MKQFVTATALSFALAVGSPPGMGGRLSSRQHRQERPRPQRRNAHVGRPVGHHGDVSITQEVRQAIVADDSLSMNAQNVKIDHDRSAS